MADRRSTVLDDLAAAMASASGEGAHLAALPRLGQVTLRAAGDAIGLAGAAVGVDLPVAANRWAGAGDRLAAWLGPDEWLLVLPDGEGGPVVARLALTLAGRRFAAVDTSAARIGFSLSGGKARAVLARDCPIDLHPRAFAAGSVAQTLLARVPVILLQRDDAPTYWILARPSYAPHLARWLIDAVGASLLPEIAGVSP